MALLIFHIINSDDPATKGDVHDLYGQASVENDDLGSKLSQELARTRLSC